MILNRQPEGEVIAVMVVWNGKPFLQKGLNSLFDALRPEDDALIVDNGSTDGSYEYVREFFPQAAILQTGENLGGAGGFNAGAKIALLSKKCKFIWLLDNDIYLDPNALQPLINVLVSEKNSAAAGSQICLYNQPEIVQEIGAGYGAWLGSLTCYYQEKSKIEPETPPYKVDYLAACSLLIRADIIKSYGLFGNFFIFYDDVDWGLRINEAGLECFAVPESLIFHNFSGLKPVTAWREYYRKRNRCLCLLIHPPAKGRFFALWVYLISLNYRITCLNWSKDQVLHSTYKKALNDFLTINFGKQIEASSPTILNVPIHDNTCNYLLDINSVGNALRLVNKIIEAQPLAKIYCVKPSVVYSLRKEYLFIEIGDLGKQPVIAILDSQFGISSVFRSNFFYKYTSDGICSMKNPLWIYFKNKLGCCLGAFSGFLLGTLHIVIAVKNRKKYL